MARRRSRTLSPCLQCSAFSYFLLNLVPLATSLFFNFSRFDQNPECPRQSPQCIQYQNDTFFKQGIQLTTNQRDISPYMSVGRAVYSEAVPLWNSATGELTNFTTHFSFAINSYGAAVSGDGLAFFLSAYPSEVPHESAGGGLGLFTLSSKERAVAVEFDTFQNEWDPSSNHVGIDITNLTSAANITLGSSLKDRSDVNARVSYQANTHNLSVFLTFANTSIDNGEYSLFYVVDLRKILPEKVAIGFAASTGSAYETHTILSWDFSSTLEIKNEKRKFGLVLGSAIGIGVFTGALGLLCFVLWRKKVTKGSQEDDTDDDFIGDEFENGKGPNRFPYSTLASATKNFADEGKLGEGGFGPVYKGFLRDLDIDVAIKRISRESKQGKKEFISEVKIISRLRHRNLVQLVGWCHSGGELLLVYEFMPNGSLDNHLYNEERLLAWPLRYKIAHGLASALFYLHEGWGSDQCVIHRDVKPSNVMLDSAFNAKLGDFGLARLVDLERGSQTTILAGTMGYLAPECVTTGKASKESDVYGFGVVALEIACGRRPIEPKERLGRVALVDWVWNLHGDGKILEAADKRLSKEYDEEQMERLMVIGLWCAHPDYNLRPSIKQVVSVLNFELPLPALPAKMPVPLYCAPPVGAFSVSSYTSSAGTSSSREALPTGSYATSSSISIMPPASSPSTSPLLKPEESNL